MNRMAFVLAGWAVLAAGSLSAAERAPTEDQYYRIIPIPIPKEIVLEVGALEMLPEGVLAVGTRRGEIYLVANAFSDPPEGVVFRRFAEGLHEVLGLAYRSGWLYVTQRCDVSRLKDTDGDGRADRFEVVCDAWDIDGDYHEYAFGSKFDPEGHLWVALCLTGSFNSNSRFRGWALRVSPDGRMIPTASGLRSPGGIGMNAAGDMFYTDNQGPWNGTCSLKHLAIGSFQGHPAGNRWYEATSAIGSRPLDPQSGSRMIAQAQKIPQLLPPAVYFPYRKMGQSASGIACDTSSGSFGPFGGQLFVGDQSHSTVMRLCLEKVGGRYQGACFPFREGLGSGSLAFLMAPDGSLLVGGTNRGWGSRGQHPFSLERLVWSGQLPFEVLQTRARPDGFELQFTQPLDPSTAARPESYRMTTYTYIYQSSYGSPEVDETTPTIDAASLQADGRSVLLHVTGLQPGHVHELHLDGIRSVTGGPLLHPVAYYTLNAIPQ